MANSGLLHRRTSCSPFTGHSTNLTPRAGWPAARHAIAGITKLCPTACTQRGFEHYLAHEDRGYIITTYRYPANDAFRFEEFYARLSELGFIIYPGKLSQEPCFRIGTIGRLEVKDMEALLAAIDNVMIAMTPVPAGSERLVQL